MSQKNIINEEFCECGHRFWCVNCRKGYKDKKCHHDSSNNTMKTKEEKAAYQRAYRRTLHYQVIEAPKQRERNRKNGVKYREAAKSKLYKKVQQETLRWTFNYWRALKEHGMTERQLIIRFDEFLKDCLDDNSVTQNEANTT